MKTLCEKVISALNGKTLATAESCTGGGIGAQITSVSGASAVYKGGIISYCNALKAELLSVDTELLSSKGPVCELVVEQMALGARSALNADVAVSVTGVAGPGADSYGNPQGMVCFGYADENHLYATTRNFEGSREEVRTQAIEYALKIVLKMQTDQL